MFISEDSFLSSTSNVISFELMAETSLSGERESVLPLFFLSNAQASAVGTNGREEREPSRELEVERDDDDDDEEGAEVGGGVEVGLVEVENTDGFGACDVVSVAREALKGERFSESSAGGAGEGGGRSEGGFGGTGAVLVPSEDSLCGRTERIAGRIPRRRERSEREKRKQGFDSSRVRMRASWYCDLGKSAGDGLIETGE